MNTELKTRHKVIVSEKEHTKSESLTESLVEAIVSGEIEPGSKISEPELAKKYQVSRGPLREAMMRLEGLGLIERIPHVGARVITFSPEKLIELYSVREALEGMAARLAARYITQEELLSLEMLLSTHSKHIDEVEGSSYFHQHGDFDFHYRIIQASRNSKLISLLCDECITCCACIVTNHHVRNLALMKHSTSTNSFCKRFATVMKSWQKC